MAGHAQIRNTKRLAALVVVLSLAVSGCGVVQVGPEVLPTAAPLKPANTQALAIPPTVTPGGIPGQTAEPGQAGEATPTREMSQPEADWPTEAEWPTETPAGAPAEATATATFPAPVLPSATAAPPTAAPTQVVPTLAPPTAAPTRPAPTPLAPTATPRPVVTPAAPATPSPQGDQVLSASGPWMLFTTGSGELWAANRDGSAARRIELGGAAARIFKPSPVGNLVALVTSQPNSLNNLQLQILSLPDVTLKAVTALMPAGFTQGAERTNMTEAAEAVVLDNLDWTADGKRLAFIGAQNGRSADVYTYTPGTGAIVRLTDGPSQAYQPRWSPDGRYVVHTGVNTFGTGAGFSMAGVWAARASGSGANALYTPPAGSGDERLLGWPDANTLLVNTWDPGCGDQDLRTVSLINGSVTTLWKGGFTMLAHSPNGQAALISVTAQQMTGCQAEKAGTFLIRPGQAPLTVNIAASGAVWSPEENAFVVQSGKQAYLLKTDGSAPNPLPAEVTGMPVFAPGLAASQQRWAWADNGAWVMGAGIAVKQVRPQADQVAWSPDGNVLFIFTQTGLYAASAPGFQANRVNPQLVTGATSPPVWTSQAGGGQGRG